MTAFFHILTHPYSVLIISIVALFFGPLIHGVIRRQEGFLRLLDGFSLIVVVGLVFMHIIPHTVTDVGWIALPLAFAGVLLPTYLEKNLKRNLAEKAHTAALLLAVIGVSFHEFTDGIALFSTYAGHADAANTTLLPLAIILHRLPIGLILWWLIRPAYGSRKALLILSVMALATCLGYWTGNTLLISMQHRYFGLFEALVAGSLVHVIFHRHGAFAAPGSHDKWQISSGIGAILGFCLLLLINESTMVTPENFQLREQSRLFLHFAMESAPALVIAYTVSGIIQGFFPRASLLWLKKGNSFGQALRGMAFGLPLPVCSCGVVPLYRTLIKQGVPLSAGLAFFVATPELGLDSFLLSFPLLGTQMTFIRLLSAALVALLIGWQIGRIFKDKIPAAPDAQPTDQTTGKKLSERFKEGFVTGSVDMVDHTGPWILVGLTIAALVHPYLTANNVLQQIPDYLQIPVFALIGMPVYVCASGATPFVAVLMAGGLSPGAAVAFLLTGPATNATTFGILAQLHGKKVSIAFAAAMAGLTIVLGYLINFLFAGSVAIPPVIAQEHHHAPYRIFFLGILGVIYMFSLLRRGPRFWINQIVAFEKEGEGHEHEDHEENRSCCELTPPASPYR